MENTIFEKLGTDVPLSYQELFELGGVKNLKHIHSNQEVLLKCGYCNKVFTKKKDYMYTCFKGKTPKNNNFFCSSECSKKYIYGENCLAKETICEQCGKVFIKKNTDLSKTKHNFCSKQCSGTYHNAHKKTGTNVSKLEKYLQQKLIEKYKNLIFNFNDIQTINMELDIYIPTLKLAFELNGIFHYEPIFGAEKLKKINLIDNNKFKRCIEKNISLCVIDTSQQKYFKEKSSQKYLDIITNIIDKNIGAPESRTLSAF